MPKRHHLHHGLLSLPALLLVACATIPPAETPVEAAQRRLPREPPVLVAEGCLYRRNLTDFNHYLRAESLQLAEDGGKEVIAELKDTHGIVIGRRVVPLMCASPLPPRGEDQEGRVAPSLAQEQPVEKLKFPVSLHAALAADTELRAAYARLFEACDHRRYRTEKLYECPLLEAAQAALLKARLKAPYVLALSIAGESASPANRGGVMMLGLLLGFIGIPGDEATARLRLISLETGALVWSSFEAEFAGRSPAGVYYDLDGGSSRYQELRIDQRWVSRLLKTLFEPQR